MKKLLLLLFVLALPALVYADTWHDVVLHGEVAGKYYFPASKKQVEGASTPMQQGDEAKPRMVEVPEAYVLTIRLADEKALQFDVPVEVWTRLHEKDVVAIHGASNGKTVRMTKIVRMKDAVHEYERHKTKSF
jgi:hypothetical protein